MEQSGPVPLITDEQPRLLQEFVDLPTEAWGQPSRCEGWSNARVLAHLAAGGELYHRSVSRALDGNTNPFGSHGEEVTPEDFRPLFLSRQEALAQQSPHEILACFAASGNALIGLYQGLSPADMDRPALHPIGMRTIGTFVAYRAYELAFHGWDIRASVDPQATIRAELAVSLVGLVRQFQSRFCRPVPDLDGACRLEVDGHAWTVVMRNGTLAEAPADADVSIKTDPSAYLLLATARRTLADLAGHVVIDGDLRLAERLLGAVCFRV